jgi:hypothetical protein
MQDNDYSEPTKNPEIVKQMVQLNLRITNNNVPTNFDRNPFRNLPSQKQSPDSLKSGQLTPLIENSESNVFNLK